MFVTCGEGICQMWEDTRNEPLRTFKWGVDSLLDVKFNPVQKDLLGTTYDESTVFLLYFFRNETSVKFQINCLCFIYIKFIVLYFKFSSLLRQRSQHNFIRY